MSASLAGLPRVYSREEQQGISTCADRLGDIELKVIKFDEKYALGTKKYVDSFGFNVDKLPTASVTVYHNDDTVDANVFSGREYELMCGMIERHNSKFHAVFGHPHMPRFVRTCPLHDTDSIFGCTGLLLSAFENVVEDVFIFSCELKSDL